MPIVVKELARCPHRAVSVHWQTALVAETRITLLRVQAVRRLTEPEAHGSNVETTRQFACL